MNYGKRVVLLSETFENKDTSQPQNDQVGKKWWEDISSKKGEKKKKIVASTCFRKGNQKVP